MGAPLVGVLAMQGDYREHVRTLESLGSPTRLVRLPEDLAGLDGLVLPGGESTTMQILLQRMGLLDALREAVVGGLPTLGTCAGMILLSRRIDGDSDGQAGFGALDATVLRNGYGRQVDSFEADLQVRGLEGGPFPAVFIRAPLVEDAGSTVVLATHDGGPVALRQGNVIGLAFHPELSGDSRLHEMFLQMVAA